MNALLQAQLSHRICSFWGQGSDFDFHRDFFFALQKKEKKTAVQVWQVEEEERRERGKSYFSSKMSKVLTTIKLTDIWL